MSTKATIAAGETFHLYKEVFDDHRIYLEIEGVQFEAGYNRVMVPIPVHVWEVIRQFAAVDLSMADMSDGEIRKMVETEVDRRILAFKANDMSAVSGFLVYGSPDDTRNNQIKSAVDYYKDKRKHALEIQSAIESLKSLVKDRR